mgnify:CR=1 FL=1
MVTQKTIAELAGVSRGTVDRVLNKRGNVNEETKKKVLDIANSMGYRPNRAGKTLVIRQKHIKIGCIMIQADNPFYTELITGIENKAAEYADYGIEVILRLSVFSATSQIALIDELLSCNINALVIQPTTEKILVEKLKAVAESGIPIVTTNTDLPDFDSFCYIGNNFYTCGKTAANLMALFTGGTGNLGVVTGFLNAKSHNDRIDGFKDYLIDYPQMNIIAIAENNDDEIESYSITKKMLEDHPEIDCMFIVAGGVYGAGRAIQEAKEQRAIHTISFDDVPTTRQLVRDEIIQATICQQPVRQGELSLEVLFNYFMDEKPPTSRTVYTDIQIKLKANIDE